MTLNFYEVVCVCGRGGGGVVGGGGGGGGSKKNLPLEDPVLFFRLKVDFHCEGAQHGQSAYTIACITAPCSSHKNFDKKLLRVTFTPMPTPT